LGGNRERGTGSRAASRRSRGGRAARQSAGKAAPVPAAGVAAQRRPRGLNENYARELMELHTLGVDGGYTQQDVIEVARALTGWTIGSRNPSVFAFRTNMHDTGTKVVLGHTLPAGRGVQDGKEVLDILAPHPSPAAYIACN